MSKYSFLPKPISEGKFAPERVKTIREISLDTIELERALGEKFLAEYSRLGVSEIGYRPIYIATYVAKRQVDKLKKELEKDGIQFLILEEVLFASLSCSIGDLGASSTSASQALSFS